MQVGRHVQRGNSNLGNSKVTGLMGSDSSWQEGAGWDQVKSLLLCRLRLDRRKHSVKNQSVNKQIKSMESVFWRGRIRKTIGKRADT